MMPRHLVALLLMTLSVSAMPQAPSIQEPAAVTPAPVEGSWRLVSYIVEVKNSNETFPPLGDKPTGYVMFSPEGRVWFMLTGEGRELGKSAQQKAKLLETIIAYTGRYRIENDYWITAVDVAWNPAWVGTEQRRQFKLEADRLQVLTPWRIMPNWADKGETRSIITFERNREARLQAPPAPRRDSSVRDHGADLEIGMRSRGIEDRVRQRAAAVKQRVIQRGMKWSDQEGEIV